VEDNTEVDGFCPHEVPIKLILSPDDPLFESKHNLWIKGESNPISPSVGVVTDDYSTNDPVSSLKAVVAAAAVGGGSLHS